MWKEVLRLSCGSLLPQDTMKASGPWPARSWHAAGGHGDRAGPLRVTAPSPAGSREATLPRGCGGPRFGSLPARSISHWGGVGRWKSASPGVLLLALGQRWFGASPYPLCSSSAEEEPGKSQHSKAGKKEPTLDAQLLLSYDQGFS